MEEKKTIEETKIF